MFKIFEHTHYILICLPKCLVPLNVMCSTNKCLADKPYNNCNSTDWQAFRNIDELTTRNIGDENVSNHKFVTFGGY